MLFIAVLKIPDVKTLLVTNRSHGLFSNSLRFQVDTHIQGLTHTQLSWQTYLQVTQLWWYYISAGEYQPFCSWFTCPTIDIFPNIPHKSSYGASPCTPTRQALFGWMSSNDSAGRHLQDVPQRCFSERPALMKVHSRKNLFEISFGVWLIFGDIYCL